MGRSARPRAVTVDHIFIKVFFGRARSDYTLDTAASLEERVVSQFTIVRQ